MQTKEDTRRVVDLCSNYYSIIEEPVAKDDVITKELWETYKFMIKNTNPNDNKKLEFLLEFNQLDPNITIETSLCNSYLEFKRDPQNKVSNTKWI